jgi:hypothetical protein
MWGGGLIFNCIEIPVPGLSQTHYLGFTVQVMKLHYELKNKKDEPNVYVNFARIQLYTVVGCDFFIIQMTPS